MIMAYYQFLAFSIFISLVGGSLYDESQLKYFTVSRTSILTVSSDVHKHGGKSIKWVWEPGDTLTLNLFHDPVQNKQLYRGGVKIWLYLTRNIHGNITLSFYTSFLVNFWRSLYPECQFNISLDFKGWRGIWVGFEECRLWPTMLPLYRMELRAPNRQAEGIYMDLLRIIRKKIRRQTRDQIVPPIRGRVRSPKEFWQQTYRWSLVKPADDDIYNEIEMNHEQFRKLKEIRLIRKRLKEWFFERKKATYDLKGHFRTQWIQLKQQVKGARQYFDKLNITRTKDFVRGPPLFSRNSEYGERNIRSPELKFGFIMRSVLLPLSLEYFIFSRKEEIQKIIEEEFPKLKDRNLTSITIQRLLAYDKELIHVFYETSKVRIRSLSRHKLRLALKDVNHKRLQRILLLLEYIVDQGWAVGSALGSLDHEMNRSSKGFVTSIFLLRKPLMRMRKISSFISIMKWYLDFGELYQNPFEYSGTTCDRMRTLMLYRLMCVVIMPEATLQQALDKLRDMEALRNWYENALGVNPALGGVIKPDYVGFHHKSFYPNDYVLPAIVSAAHVVYLLRGTSYQIQEDSRRNLGNAINFMRILSVKYSIPNSVENTDPTVAKPELICLIPAFAYMAVSECGSSGGQFVPRKMSTQAMGSLRAFLRLFNESNADVKRYLWYGSGCIRKTSFTYSLGSLGLIHRLKRRARELGIEAEQSPKGNWAKNFAALTIHRRQDWAVTVKGFNNFVWGHESSRRGNHYGLYQSYGQLIIANSDHALKAQNIDKGWDWTRLPGTTTLRVPLRKLLMKHSRFYNPKDLCGAVNFRGTSRLRNGAFVMDFQRPNYELRNKQEGEDTHFWFKKSVFFYDELLVCLGSGIRAIRKTPVEVETTLFQNTVIIDDVVHHIKVNGFEVLPRPDDAAKRFAWEKNSVAILTDINGNGYYIPKAGKQNLNLWLGKQNSYSGKFKKKRTEGHFATAWLNHGANPMEKTYQYAILVNTSYARLRKFAGQQQRLRGWPKYEVLQLNKYAHVVKFTNSPRLGLTTFGYSVFAENVVLPGPLWMVGSPCVIMAEDGGSKSTRLIIGVSYPQLNFNSTKKLRTAGDVGDEELFYMRSQEKQIWILLRGKVWAHGYRVYVDGKLLDSNEAVKHVIIIPSHPGTSAGSLVFFTKLRNGFTTEVHFRRVASSQEIIT